MEATLGPEILSSWCSFTLERLTFSPLCCVVRSRKLSLFSRHTRAPRLPTRAVLGHSCIDSRWVLGAGLCSQSLVSDSETGD